MRLNLAKKISEIKKTQKTNFLPKKVKHFEINYDHLNLDIVAVWEDTSFEHEFGREVQGFWDLDSIFYNDFEIPIQLVSSTVCEHLIEKLNA